MIVELEPLHPGTISSINWKETPAQPRPTNDPRALPKDKVQCVHVDCTYVDLGSAAFIPQSKRCAGTASSMGRQGWLCPTHYEVDENNSRPRLSKVPKTQEQIDDEVVGTILVTEARAIARGKREVARIGAKLRVTYLL
jgi:hypothetical protein